LSAFLYDPVTRGIATQNPQITCQALRIYQASQSGRQPADSPAARGEISAQKFTTQELNTGGLRRSGLASIKNASRRPLN
jgi:hypothetical protein